MLRHNDRLNEEEAAEVARLHAERMELQQTAEIAERERIAATTTPEELASVIGASPEEVRQLAEEVRSAATNRKTSGPSPAVGITILVLVVLFVMLLALYIPVNR